MLVLVSALLGMVGALRNAALAAWLRCEAKGWFEALPLLAALAVVAVAGVACYTIESCDYLRRWLAASACSC